MAVVNDCEFFGAGGGCPSKCGSCVRACATDEKSHSGRCSFPHLPPSFPRNNNTSTRPLPNHTHSPRTSIPPHPLAADTPSLLNGCHRFTSPPPSRSSHYTPNTTTQPRGRTEPITASEALIRAVRSLHPSLPFLIPKHGRPEPK
ncbi:hypothetical protein BDY17DRAFT_78757 [Neohortaea acidophila]|uniref:Uncharacterized protein n=1 Tax=Neohortaea acidophila TaxID=245834 RepID=A0A6A6Q2E2_9PEZI|nr:uncharacterized protein BDY17DRAFT_78757 [Neohortaea acidophila]KAF2486422.1 hypothetical protein BDY17DRAFT_78757 [Neohortaea acidophila]